MAVATATALTIAATASLVGAGISAYGAYQQGQAQDKAAEFNAKLSEMEAANAQAESLENIRRERKRNRRYLSRQRALIAGRGIAMEGSALEVLSQSARNLELGIQDAFRSSQIQTNSLLAEASMSRFEGKQAKRAANLRAGATLVSGAGDILTSNPNLIT